MVDQRELLSLGFIQWRSGKVGFLFHFPLFLSFYKQLFPIFEFGLQVKKCKIL